ncbi:hypothetical protein SDJN03_14914, partial [Cucurbita argyrosperma subsp. sororia]
MGKPWIRAVERSEREVAEPSPISAFFSPQPVQLFSYEVGRKIGGASGRNVNPDVGVDFTLVKRECFGLAKAKAGAAPTKANGITDRVLSFVASEAVALCYCKFVIFGSWWEISHFLLQKPSPLIGFILSLTFPAWFAVLLLLRVN